MHGIPAECLRDGRIAQHLRYVEVVQQNEQDRHAALRIDPQIAGAGLTVSVPASRLRTWVAPAETRCAGR